MKEVVIMTASNLTDGRKADLKKICEIWPGGDQAVIVAVKDNKTKIFIVSGGRMPFVVDQKVDYVQDTGNGHGARGQLVIENQFLISDDVIVDDGNSIGFDEKRRLWVFK